jgi:hypothetical protein
MLVQTQLSADLIVTGYSYGVYSLSCIMKKHHKAQ